MASAPADAPAGLRIGAAKHCGSVSHRQFVARPPVGEMARYALVQNRLDPRGGFCRQDLDRQRRGVYGVISTSPVLWLLTPFASVLRAI